MDEIYRMLGREHEADLAREAAKFSRAALVRGTPWWRGGVRARLALRKRRRETTPVSLPAAIRQARGPAQAD
jgi:hypothetical protein